MWSSNLFCSQLIKDITFTLNGFCFERVVTYFNVYMKLEVIVGRNMRLFPSRDKTFFSIVAGSIWFVFCFRLNIFIIKISNLLLPLGAERAGGRESWCTSNILDINKYWSKFVMLPFQEDKASISGRQNASETMSSTRPIARQTNESLHMCE